MKYANISIKNRPNYLIKYVEYFVGIFYGFSFALILTTIQHLFIETHILEEIPSLKYFILTISFGVCSYFTAKTAYLKEKDKFINLFVSGFICFISLFLSIILFTIF